MPPSSLDLPITGTLPARAPAGTLYRRSPRRSWFARFFLSPFDDLDDRATSRAEGRRAEKAERQTLKVAEHGAARR
jgi:hypothetical protein